MTRLKNPSTLEVDPFWQAYKETMDGLRLLNKKFPMKSRLPIFKLYYEIYNMPVSMETELCLYRLDVLREIITRGLEPAHKNNKYV